MHRWQVILGIYFIVAYCQKQPAEQFLTTKNSAIVRGIAYLQSLQQKDGAIVSTESPSDSRIGQTAYALAGLLAYPKVADPRIIEKAQQFLRSNMLPTGLWRYQPFLPPDLDDTTAALAALPTDSQGEALRIKVIRTVLGFQKSDGGIPTWLTTQSELEILGLKNFPAAEIHPEVMAYFFSVFTLKERNLFREERERALRYLLGKQKQGRWQTTWYRSDLYATSRVCDFILQFIESCTECRKALESARAYVIRRQRADGSWGKDAPSFLDTAFALQILKNSGGGQNLLRARQFLLAGQLIEGAWPAEPFFFLDISQRSRPEQHFIGNKLYSTAIVLLALRD